MTEKEKNLMKRIGLDIMDIEAYNGMLNMKSFNLLVEKTDRQLLYIEPETEDPDNGPLQVSIETKFLCVNEEMPIKIVVTDPINASVPTPEIIWVTSDCTVAAVVYDPIRGFLLNCLAPTTDDPITLTYSYKALLVTKTEDPETHEVTSVTVEEKVFENTIENIVIGNTIEYKTLEVVSGSEDCKVSMSYDDETVEANNSVSGSFRKGATVTIKAIPGENYVFTKWNDDNTEAEREVTIGDEDATYTATFESTVAIITLNTSSTQGYTGTVSINGGTPGTTVSATVNKNDSVTIEAFQDQQGTWSGWYIGSDELTTDNPYNFDAIDNITITATFNNAI